MLVKIPLNYFIAIHSIHFIILTFMLYVARTVFFVANHELIWKLIENQHCEEEIVDLG